MILKVHNFPPLAIEKDNKLGIDKLKILVSMSLQIREDIERVIALKNASLIKRIFSGYGRLVVSVLESVIEIAEAADLIKEQLEDLDFYEIKELATFVAKTHKFDTYDSRDIIEKIKDLFSSISLGKKQLREI